MGDCIRVEHKWWAYSAENQEVSEMVRCMKIHFINIPVVLSNEFYSSSKVGGMDGDRDYMRGAFTTKDY